MSTANIEDSYRLCAVQEGMLFHGLYARQSGVDVEQLICRLREDLNIPAFRAAWQAVVARHPVLRTSFRWKGLEQPLQDVYRHVTVPLEQEDWRGWSENNQGGRLQQYLQTDRTGGFRMDHPPLMRLALFRIGEADYQCVWSFHHALLDGRSFPLVLNEVFALYEAYRQGEDAALPYRRPYRDFVEWLQQQDLSKAEAFWRRALEGFTSPSFLVVDDAAGKVPGNEGAHREQDLRVSASVTSALRALAEQSGVTLNTIVEGAWALLLSRYNGEEDVVFGVTRACRSTFEEAGSMVGLLINAVPIRAHVPADMSLRRWLKALRVQDVAMRPFEHTPLVKIQAWSSVPRGTALFESLLVFENYLLNSLLQKQGGNWINRTFRLSEQTNYPLTLYGYSEPQLLLKIAFDRHRFGDASVARMLGHLQTLLEGMAANPEGRLSELPLLTQAERHRVLVDWNETQTTCPKHKCIHQLFEEQVVRTPHAVALAFQDKQLTYSELNSRANQLARHLEMLKVAPEVLVGLCVERSVEMVVGLLGILKAGGAYVPLDPRYPKERLAFMIADAQISVLLTQYRLLRSIPENSGRVLCLDSEWTSIATHDDANRDGSATSDNLAYVIYTSGSTGEPKGVMVEHSNVVNFFTGMDGRIGHDPDGVWLAVTSMSFDISVLELLWTLIRGFKVVLHAEDDLVLASIAPRSDAVQRPIDFSLFYFASHDHGMIGDKYRLLIEGTKFADQKGFAAVWTPERHFHPFGGLYPNPSVTSALLAGITERIQLRAGSVVLPLHSPIRVAEEWSVVDNLSKGRVGISFASGWHDKDFALAPANYARRKEVTQREIDTVRRLWRGETITCQGGAGNEVEIKIFPKPIQKELPVWITAAGGPETFRLAGEMGANVLTHLLFQSVEDVSAKIAIYRQAWRSADHQARKGHVTLMLHTFVGQDLDEVREKVRKPFCEYMKSSVDLIKQLAEGMGQQIDVKDLKDEDLEALLAHAFDRYFETSGLFGTPRTCLEMINRLKAIGVDEVACLIDFGVDGNSVISSLPNLNTLRKISNQREERNGDGYSLPHLISRHGVSHLQCTPSLARVLTTDAGMLEHFGSLEKLFLGGEALPVSLAAQLREVMSGEILNMYGPTETTIWSTMHRLGKVGNMVPIGRPIANTKIYLLDRHLQPVPIGVPGELFIGGAGVARGYLRRPEVTSEKFLRDPFSDEPGTRMYRTGDLARYLPDGNLEFLGRLDDQVKVRGYRIEPAEIEAALEQHPKVREAVVLARQEALDQKRLVAYLTTHQRPTSVTDLRNFLRDRLPEHMIPSAFIFLDRLPRTPNGKVDRRSLPTPGSNRPELKKTFIAPRTSIEKALARIWSQTLGIEQVGVKDNFFELGGDSILAVRIMGAASQAGLHLTVRQLFETPTIRDLARAMIAQEPAPGQTQRIARLLNRVENMSTEEVRKVLREKRTAVRGR